MLTQETNFKMEPLQSVFKLKYGQEEAVSGNLQWSTSSMRQLNIKDKQSQKIPKSCRMTMEKL